MPDPDRRPDGAVTRRTPDGDDRLVREEPLQIEIDGSQLVTMRTPGDDVALATGFVLGEGLATDVAAIRSIDAIEGDTANGTPDRIVVTLSTPPPASARTRLARTHEIRASCGVCGTASVDALLDDLPPLLPGVPRISRATVAAAVARLSSLQPLFTSTGGAHAAALFDAHLTLLGSGEDVGRHNALDKAIGAAARAGADLSRAFVVLSGRAGFDLVVKCLRTRIPFVVSVSAPSALAFDLCDAAGATLLGFARDGRWRTYTGAQRVVDRDD